MMKQGLKPSDEELWEAFKAGDERAYERMFRDHYGLLVNYGLKFNNREDEVKDYVQQLFTSLWESKARLGSNNNIKGYLLASLRRMILRGNKQRYMFVDLSGIGPKFMLEASSENHYERSMIEKEEASMVAHLVNTLPARQKEALYLRYYNEQSFSEIAQVMGITTRAVYKLIYKATAKLADTLGQKQEQDEAKIRIVAS